MSKVVYCSIEPCFRKQMVNKPDDVLHIGWAKLDNGYSCESHTWESKP